MPNLWSLITGPIFKFIVIVLCGAIAGWLACDRIKVGGLEARIWDLQQKQAKCEADLGSTRLVAGSVQKIIAQADEQCKAKIEALRSKPSMEISPDVEVDDNLIDRLRRGGMRDSGKSGGSPDSAGARPGLGTSGAQAP